MGTSVTRARVRRLAQLRGHPVVRNAGALYAVQAARYLIPLALVPFLARVLRPESFGRLAAAQSLAASLGVAAEYGFIFSGTREIARHRDADSMGLTVASVLGAKLLLATCIAAIGLILLLSVAPLRSAPAFLWGACFLAVAQAASPAWFFQGIEQMALECTIELFGAAAGAGAVFTFVRQPRQAASVLFLVGAGALGAALANYVRVYRRVHLKHPRWRPSIGMLQRGFAMFFLRGSVALYTVANVFLLGLFLPPGVVADFAGAEKIVRACIGFLNPSNQALFPRMSHLMSHNRPRGLLWARRVLALYASAAAAGTAILYWTAPLLVRLALGPGYSAAVPLLHGLSLLIFPIAVSNVLALQIMLPLGMDWAVNTILAGAAAINISAMLVLVPRLGAEGMVWAVVASEAVVAIAMAVLVLRSGALTGGKESGSGLTAGA
ncbi:MAG: oligosaccharide flippase family protein [Terriglobales bacterium]